jgi:hypothetical protein
VCHGCAIRIYGHRADPLRGILPRVSVESELRQRLDGLLALADSDRLTVTSNPQLALSHAWFARCIDSTNAALQLSDHGLREVATPLLRAAIEHAVGMVWLQRLGDDALAAVDRSHKRWGERVREAIATANREEATPGRDNWSPALDAAFDALAAREVPEGQVAGEWKIDNRFKVARTFDLYVAWLSETAGSHATHTSAAPYVVPENGRYQLLRVPQVVTSEPMFIIQCAMAAILAFRTMADMLSSDIWHATVEEADRAMVESYLQLKQSGQIEGSPPADWRSRHDR